MHCWYHLVPLSLSIIFHLPCPYLLYSDLFCLLARWHGSLYSHARLAGLAGWLARKQNTPLALSTAHTHTYQASAHRLHPGQLSSAMCLMDGRGTRFARQSPACTPRVQVGRCLLINSAEIAWGFSFHHFATLPISLIPQTPVSLPPKKSSLLFSTPPKLRPSPTPQREYQRSTVAYSSQASLRFHAKDILTTKAGP